jgi:hypothetical protein
MDNHQLLSEIAVFARSAIKFLENFPKKTYKEIPDIHIDTMFILIQYSTLFFINNDFSKYLTRCLDMMLSYCEYVKHIYGEEEKQNIDKEDYIINDAKIACDATTFIIYRFISIIPLEYTKPSASLNILDKSSTFGGSSIGTESSEDMMKEIVNLIKETKEPTLINNITRDICNKYFKKYKI